jgi:hypothetical protein
MALGMSRFCGWADVLRVLFQRHGPTVGQFANCPTVNAGCKGVKRQEEALIFYRVLWVRRMRLRQTDGDFWRECC